MRLKWPFFLTSLGIAAAGAKLVRRHETQELNSLYVGSWEFSHPHEKRLHTITIYPDLSIILDGSAIIYQLIELSEQKLAIQDQFGYHLIIKTKNGTPDTLYDELDDISLTLVPTTLNPQKEGVPMQ
ncbi:DUF4828 domain-containing protein [Enterococcus devriesei]|uniref:DUF4828 domain-containing protein n=1 Tax=Enterococcus devriesei TaxID=319970 RepID=UPI0036D2BEC5